MHDLTQLTAVELSMSIARQQVSCVEVMIAYLDRIGAINPALNAIVALRPRDELIKEARLADKSPRKGWLHGMPFAIKDLEQTAGIRSTHGSLLFVGHVPQKDDLLPARIRAAGAIIIGKTNTPEFGVGSHSYNLVYGVTRNPYDTSKSAGGSSGGAGAALAARLLPVADGSDMMGSLRNPAAFNNVYGFRPGFGRVPSEPLGDTFLHQLATEGPMGRTVNDMAHLLDIMAVPDRRLPHHNPVPPAFSAKPLRPASGKRIGWIGDWGGYYPVEPEILALCEQGLQVFEQAGSRVEAVTPAFDPARIWKSWQVLRQWAIAGGLQVLYLDPGKRKLLKPEVQWEIENGMSLSAMEVHAASVIRSQWHICLEKLYEEYDALIMPSAQLFPFAAELHWPDQVCGRAMETYHQWMEIVIPVSLAGLPALAVPVGFGAAGLPAGMQLFGKRGDDLAILELGEAYHQATDWPSQRPPVL